MQGVQGYLTDGWFTPTDEIMLPRRARVRLVIEEEIIIEQATEMLPLKLTDEEKQARLEGLKKIKADLALIEDEDLSDFPQQGLMKLPHDYAWHD